MKIEYSPPRRRQPVFACFKAVVKLFTRKVRVVVPDGKLEENCIYVANHSNKMGPMIYSMYFPVGHVKWGAHEMFESYAVRRRYIRDVLYIQKNGMSRGRAAFRAFFEAFFSPFIYRGMRLLPTYTDGRLTHIVKKSVEILADNTAIMIFPENSEDGYHDVLKEFFSGFVLVAVKYRQAFGRDVPIRPLYYHKRKRIIVAGEACTLADFEGLKRAEIAEAFRQKVNALYDRIESGEFDKKN